VKLKIEQSDTEFYTPTAGLYFIGHAINQETTLRKTLRSVSRRHGIPNIELIRTYVGLLVMGKSDFEAVENVRNDDWFQHCMGIRKIPSSSRLRQRFDEDAIAINPLIEDISGRGCYQSGCSRHIPATGVGQAPTCCSGYRYVSHGQQRHQEGRRGLHLQRS